MTFALPPVVVRRPARGRPGTIEAVPRLPNADRRHWAARARATRAWRTTAFLVGASEGLAALELGGGIVIRMVRVRSRGPEADDDNATASFKPVRDGLADAIFGAGKGPTHDNDPRIRWEVAQERGARAGVRVDIIFGPTKEEP